MRTPLLILFTISLLHSFGQDKTPQVLKPFLNEASAFTNQKEYTKALNIYEQKVLPTLLTQTNPYLSAYTQIKIAENHRKTRDLEAAQAHMQLAWTILSTLETDSTRGHYFFELGNIQRSQKQYVEAISSHKEAVGLYEKHFSDDHLNVVKALFGLGKDFQAMRDTDSTEYYFVSMLQRMVPNPDISLAEKGKRYRGVAAAFHQQRQKPDSTIGFYRKAIAYFEQAGIENLEYELQYQYYRSHYVLSDRLLQRFLPHQAKSMLDKLDGLLLALPDTFRNKGEIEAFCMQTWGDYYRKVDDHTRAQDTYQQLIIKWEGLTSEGKALRSAQRNVPIIYQRLAFLAHSQGDYRQAIEYLQRAIPIFNRPGYWDERAELLFQIAEYYLDSHAVDSALQYIQLADNLIIEKGLSNRNHLNGLSSLTQGLIHLFHAQHNPLQGFKFQKANQAIKDFAEARNYFGRVSSIYHDDVFKTYLQTGKTHLLLDQYQEAIASIDEAIRINHWRATGASNPAQVRSYSRLIEALTLKSQVFKKQYLRSTNDQNELATALSILHQADQYLDQQVTSLSQEGSRRIFRNRLRNLYEEALGVSQLAYAETHALSYLEEQFYFMEKSKALSLLEHLHDQEARLKAGVEPRWLEREAQLKSDLQYLTQRWKDQDFDQAIWVELARLREKNIEFVDSLEKAYPNYFQLKYDLQVRRLNDIQSALQPHEALVQYFWGDSSLFILGLNAAEGISLSLPLTDSLKTAVDLLQNQWSPKTDAIRTGTEDWNRYLIGKLLLPMQEIWQDKEHLTILPDGPLNRLPFDALRVEKDSLCPYLICEMALSYDYSATLHLRNRQKNILIPEDGARALFLAPSPFRVAEQPRLPDLSQISTGHELIQNMLGGKYLFHSRATKEKFEDLAPQYQILHLATHGAMDEQELFSWIAFPENLLYAHEIYNLQLDSSVAFIVLGACETGLGRLEKSEGAMSLARAFFYAGCPSVMMTLWQSNGESTFDRLLPAFYQHLQNHQTKAEALRQAKIELIRNPGYAGQVHPHHWAGLVITGNQDNLPLAPPSPFPTLPFAGILLLLGLLVLVGVWRRRKKRFERQTSPTD